MPDFSDGLLSQVYRCLKQISQRDGRITEEWLSERYKSLPNRLKGKESKLKNLRPDLVVSWRRLCAANNDPDGIDALVKAVERTRHVVQKLGIDISDLEHPLDGDSCRNWLNIISSRLKAHLVALVGRSGIRTGATAGDITATQTIDIFQALQTAFGLSDRDIRKSGLPLGRYYGYRRSANSGDIVRFSVELSEDPSTGMLRFDNHYNRLPHPWSVSGHGVGVSGDVTHLFGNAMTSPLSPVGEGIRFFTLQMYKFGWVVGLLDSRDKNGKPISARIVLIPAEQHKKGKDYLFDPTDKAFMTYLEKGNDRSTLDDEIEVGSEDRRLFGGLKEVELIKSLIWNGSVRALHGEPQPIPRREDHLGLTRLIEIQERVLAFGEHPANDVYLFTQLLSNNVIYGAVNRFLRELEKRPRRPLAELRSLEPP